MHDLRFPRLEEIESQLLAEMTAAHERFREGKCTREEFRAVLRRFNDFVIYGRLPDDVIGAAFGTTEKSGKELPKST